VYNVVVKKIHVRYLISWWASCILSYALYASVAEGINQSGYPRFRVSLCVRESVFLWVLFHLYISWMNELIIHHPRDTDVIEQILTYIGRTMVQRSRSWKSCERDSLCNAERIWTKNLRALQIDIYLLTLLTQVFPTLGSRTGHVRSHLFKGHDYWHDGAYPSTIRCRLLSSSWVDSYNTSVISRFNGEWVFEPFTCLQCQGIRAKPIRKLLW